MSDWNLPEIPEEEVSTDEIVDDQLDRPKDYNKASNLITKSISASSNGNLNLALEFLQEAAEMCPFETTIWILMGDLYLDLNYHQKAIKAYKIGAAYGDHSAKKKLKSIRARSLIDEVNNILNSNSSNKIPELRNLLLNNNSEDIHWAKYRDLAKRINKLSDKGAADLSWSLLNKSLQKAMNSEADLHTVYTEMGNQLYQKENYSNAIQNYILTYIYSPTPSPKYILGNLKKCFKRLKNSKGRSFEEFHSFIKKKKSLTPTTQTSQILENIIYFLR